MLGVVRAVRGGGARLRGFGAAVSKRTPVRACGAGDGDSGGSGEARGGAVQRRRAAATRAAVPRPRPRRRGVESQVRDSLAASIPGSRTEVPCSAGVVDILTPEQVIEVKSTRLWKSGLGQLLAYKADFGDKELRLHLFGAGDHFCLARRVCADYGILVTVNVSAEAAAAAVPTAVPAAVPAAVAASVAAAVAASVASRAADKST